MPDFQQMATDAFTGTNGTHLPTYSANWSSNATGNAVQINTNGIVPSGSAGVISAYGWNAFLFSPQQYSIATYGTASAASGNAIGPAVLIATDGSQNYYGLLANGTDYITFFKKVADAYTELATEYPVALGSLGLVASTENQFFAIVQDTAHPLVSDSSLAEGAAGICAKGTSTSVRIDSWEAGNYDAGDTSVFLPSTVITSQNFTGVGTIATIQDDPSSPDGTWITATDQTLETFLEVSFDTEGVIGVAAGVQAFSIFARSTSGAEVLVSVEIKEIDSYKAFASFIVSDTGGTKHDIAWIPTSIPPANVADIRFRVGVIPSGSDNFDIGAIRWLARVSLDPLLSDYSESGTPFMGQY